MSKQLGGPCDLCLDSGMWTPADAPRSVVIALRPAGASTSPAREQYAMCDECASQGPEEAWERYEVVSGEVPAGSPWAKVLATEYIVECETCTGPQSCTRTHRVFATRQAAEDDAATWEIPTVISSVPTIEDER